MGLRETAEDKFARLVKLERASRGWSQARLAEEMTRFGVKTYPTTIAKIEQRDGDSPRTIRLNEAIALSSILDIQIGDLTPSTSDLQVVYTADKVAMAARKASRQVDAAIDELSKTFESLDSMGYALSNGGPSQGEDHAERPIEMTDEAAHHLLIALYHSELRRVLSESGHWVSRISAVPWMSHDELANEFALAAEEFGLVAPEWTEDDSEA